LAEFAYNNTMHVFINKSNSILLQLCHHPQVDAFQVKDVGNSAAEDLVAHLAAIHDELAFQLNEAQDRYKDYVDHNWKLHPNFHIGDHVWFLRWDIQTKRPSRKLNYQRLSPFKIIA
jgi:hypothetical protein